MKPIVLGLIVASACLITPCHLRAEDAPFTRKEVIYGRKHGTALTMDVFAPKMKANGAGVIFIVSGGWFSAHAAINPGIARPFLDKGYTVFAVVHGSQPKFAIPEILEDLHRAVRFIRHNAKDYGIDPERLGVMGGSAGGHLSLMQGCASKTGDPKASDPVDRASSRVAAVAAFYPPTDFLNWGEKDKVMLGRGLPFPLMGPFDFQELNPKTGAFEPVQAEEKVNKIGREISPINHTSKDDPPTLIIHGDEDALVPVQQAKIMAEKLEEAGVKTELIVVKGGKHDGKLISDNLPKVVAWFDKHLAAREKE